MKMLTRSLLRFVWIGIFAVGSMGQRGLSTDSPEREVLQAVAHDPHLFALNQDLQVLLVMAPASELPWAHSWVAPSKNPPDAWIKRDDGTGVFAVPVDLIEAARKQNRKSISLRFVSLPKTDSQLPKRVERRIVSLSRPGISVDGIQALVAVTLTWQANGLSMGYTVHLHHDQGTWQIDGHGPDWIE